jgi:hypothetical protein
MKERERGNLESKVLIQRGLVTSRSNIIGEVRREKIVAKVIEALFYVFLGTTYNSSKLCN